MFASSISFRLKPVGKVGAGTPQVRLYEVCNSTFHKIAAPAAA
jgi:hypothetical protein